MSFEQLKSVHVKPSNKYAVLWMQEFLLQIIAIGFNTITILIITNNEVKLLQASSWNRKVGE